MFKKFRFYKNLLAEMIETLCTICLFLESEGRRYHNYYTVHMRDHFTELKYYSMKLRGMPTYEDEESRSKRISF